MTEPKPRGNPAMQKGAPSVNPYGRNAPLVRAQVAKARTVAPGTTGVVSGGGSSTWGSGSRDLNGARRWTTYRNALNFAVVATGIRYVGNLLAGTDWHTEPNPRGGKDAEVCAEIVREGLLEAPLGRPWSSIVRKASMYRWVGFSLFATAKGRRKDGRILFTDIAHRPQHTISEWLRERNDETLPFTAVKQITGSGKSYRIELEDCFYCVDDLLDDDPAGTGLLRHVVELTRRLGLYETLEGSAFFQDIGGLPVARVPLEEIAGGVPDGDEAAIKAAIAAAAGAIREAVSSRVKTPEVQQWLELDSATYKTSDDSPSGVKKWDVEVLRGETNGIAEINTTIGRINLEIARVLGIEFALVGGGDSAGSYGMHADKTSMFGANVQSMLDEISNFAERQLARSLVVANGYDPDTCTPRLVAEPIAVGDIESVARTLSTIMMAGLSPDDPARNILRKRMWLPPEPEPNEDLMLRRPAAPPFPPAKPTDVGTEPEDPAEDREAV